MNDLTKFVLSGILILFTFFGIMLIIDRDKYSHYNMLTPEGKCKWEVARDICIENDYGFRNINIVTETAKCLTLKSDGEYKTIRIKLCQDELAKCYVAKEHIKPKDRCEEKVKDCRD